MTTRVSFVRVGILAVVVVAAVWGVVALMRPVLAAPEEPVSPRFAAYVDVTAVPSHPFETPEGPSEQDVILAFVVADPDAPCTPAWGAYYSMDEAASALELDRRITQLRQVGGSARISFGGAANTELAVACTDVDALASAYRSVVERYEVASIDLDLEGAALQDAPAMARRAQALQQVQQHEADAGRSLAVWVTVPVTTAGLTDEATQAVQSLLDAGVTVAGVNGMTMDFGAGKPEDMGMGVATTTAATSMQAQVRAAFAQAGLSLSDQEAWARVGVTPMIGQNDTPGEVFTFDDASAVNDFALEHGLGLVSMWSENRDATCQRPLPKVLTVVQTSCSGVDQGELSFAEVLGSGAEVPVSAPTATPVATPTVAGAPIVDDPKTSPFPIWDPLGTYPAGTKVVWKKNVYEAKWWTSGVDPSVPKAAEGDMPWLLLGPVMPGDRPAPLPTLPAGTYEGWQSERAYVAGARVQLDGVPYQAKWWTQGQRPGDNVAGGSPWVLVYPQ